MSGFSCMFRDYSTDFIEAAAYTFTEALSGKFDKIQLVHFGTGQGNSDIDQIGITQFVC